MKKAFIITIFISLFISSCHVGRFFIYNFADIRDYKKFPSKILKASDTAFYFMPASVSNSIVLPKAFHYHKKEFNMEGIMRKSGTVAFLIIRNDTIVYEWYGKNKNEKSIVPSFSMSKSFVSALIGIAIDEGKIKSTEDPITNYLDFLIPEKFGKITIQHLLDMQSGIKFNESYFNPFGDVAKYYYGTHLKKYMRHLKIKEPPGKHFEYISLNTQLLAAILEKATGKSVTEYLQEKIWTPLGMEQDASWSIDSKRHQTEKAFCCINARAKDYAKLGRLYLNDGNWNGKQIVSKKWIDESVNFKEYKNFFLYSNHWWHSRNFYPASDTLKLQKPWKIYYSEKDGKRNPYVCQPGGDYFAEGHLSQFIYIAPEKKMIFVRLGTDAVQMNWSGLFQNMAHQQLVNE